MAHWALVVAGESLAAPRLFHHDTLELAGLNGQARPVEGDDVLVLAEKPEPAVVAVGRVIRADPLTLAYTRQCFDDPQPAGHLALAGALTALEPAAFRALADRVAPTPEVRTWLVSVDLPIEAGTPAEAVRRFWSYVMELGPRELPAFVAPSDDELAMQAFVLGEPTNLDPEEDDEED
jgi:hypothetical protein